MSGALCEEGVTGDGSSKVVISDSERKTMPFDKIKFQISDFRFQFSVRKTWRIRFETAIKRRLFVISFDLTSP